MTDPIYLIDYIIPCVPELPGSVGVCLDFMAHGRNVLG